MRGSARLIYFRCRCQDSPLKILRKATKGEVERRLMHRENLSLMLLLISACYFEFKLFWIQNAKKKKSNLQTRRRLLSQWCTHVKMNSIKKEDGSLKQQRRSTFTRLKRKKKSKFSVITIDYLLNSQAQPFIRTNKVQKLNLKSKESK